MGASGSSPFVEARSVDDIKVAVAGSDSDSSGGGGGGDDGGGDGGGGDGGGGDGGDGGPPDGLGGGDGEGGGGGGGAVRSIVAFSVGVASTSRHSSGVFELVNAAPEILHCHVIAGSASVTSASDPALLSAGLEPLTCVALGEPGWYVTIGLCVHGSLKAAKPVPVAWMHAIPCSCPSTADASPPWLSTFTSDPHETTVPLDVRAANAWSFAAT